MKRINEFENFDDFGFTTELGVNNLPNLISCGSECNTTKTSSSIDLNLIYTDVDGVMGKYYSLENIVSGGSSTISLSIVTGKTSAELSIDASVYSNLAYFGSVYSVISSSLTKIKDGYPNGFLIINGDTGANSTFIFNHNQTYTYGSQFDSSSDYIGFGIYTIVGTSIQSSHKIIGATGGTGRTILTLDGTPITGATTTYAIYPLPQKLSEFYATTTDYELDLLVPPFDRSNYWPRDSIVEENLVIEGSPYITFVSNELNEGLSTDTTDTNFLWEKLYPNGQKNLDTDDNIMQKLIQSFAMNFDYIKKYQDQLKYVHTIGYENHNHISKDLVGLLAHQWNWTLATDLNQSDYSDYLLPVFENYVTGQSQQKLSQKDINFERWRRILANVVYLYKKKGTKEGIKYLTNLYGIPERLLVIDELIKVIDSNNSEAIVVSPSNIVIPIDGVMKYISENGSLSALSYSHIENTKYLNITIDPASAIEYEYYDWGWEYHPDVIDVNGNILVLSGLSKPTRLEWEANILHNLIPSDGTGKYAYNYPLLENEAKVYYDNAAIPFTLDTLQPFIDFLDDNWSIMCTKLVPASSKLMSMGTTYRNNLWNREKYQWDEENKKLKELPFNKESTFDIFIPEITHKKQQDALIDVTNINSSYATKSDGIIEITEITSVKNNKISGMIYPINEFGKKYGNYYGSIVEYDMCGALQDEITNIYELNIIDNGDINYANSPLMIPISGQYGSSLYVDYNDDCIIHSNDTTIDITMSASNLSESGYTKITTQLFKKLEDGYSTMKNNIEYSIVEVIFESDNYGVYKLSSTRDLEIGDIIKVTSSYIPNIIEEISISYVNRDNGTIKTEPNIGLFKLPVGSGHIIDWSEFIKTNILFRMNIGNINYEFTYQSIILILNWLIINFPILEERTIEHIQLYAEFLDSISDQYGYNYADLMHIFGGLASEELKNIYSALVVIEFVKKSEN